MNFSSNISCHLTARKLIIKVRPVITLCKDFLIQQAEANRRNQWPVNNNNLNLNLILITTVLSFKNGIKISIALELYYLRTI